MLLGPSLTQERKGLGLTNVELGQPKKLVFVDLAQVELSHPRPEGSASKVQRRCPRAVSRTNPFLWNLNASLRLIGTLCFIFRDSRPRASFHASNGQACMRSFIATWLAWQQKGVSRLWLVLMIFRWKIQRE